MLPVASSDEPDSVQIVINTEGSGPAVVHDTQQEIITKNNTDRVCGSKITDFITQRLRVILYLAIAGIITAAVIHIDKAFGSNLSENQQVQDVLRGFLQLALGKQLNTTATPPVQNGG